MTYLTSDEYLDYTGETQTPLKFQHLLNRASAELDVLTRFYYKHNDLETDLEWRKNQFKLALVAQIEFYINKGTTSSEAMNSAPDSVKIGDTTVSYNQTQGSAEQSVRENAVSQDAINYLSGTGLLYRGASGYGIRTTNRIF